MQKIRWGLLSTARINRRVIPAIRQSERGDLVAVASRTQDAVDSYAAEWDIPQTFDSYIHRIGRTEIGGRYLIMSKISVSEAKVIFERVGLEIPFEGDKKTTKFVLGKGNFGTIKVAFDEIENTYVASKGVKGSENIKESTLQVDK